MNKEELLEYINLFREKAENNKLIIFVGSGVSLNVDGMPSWYSLIQKMAQTINYSKCSTCKNSKDGCSDFCLLKEDYSTDELLKIPQYVYNKSKDLYDKILKENIKDVSVDAPLSEAIFDINPVHIITTNYDTLLESSKNEFCEQYQVIVHDKDLLNAEKSKYIIKMHGDINDLDTIILKEEDYLNYSQEHVLLELFVKSLLVDHTILFLGYSLNDYNIKLIISWLNYMRSQNNALSSWQKVGYIVLDEYEISDTQISYFAGNNIGVINIYEMPTTNNIPRSLAKEKGKRLYSLLKVIADSSLEEELFSSFAIERAVDFMSQHTYVEYKLILKLLFIKNYDKVDDELRLFSEKDYNKLENFMSEGGQEAEKLKQLFVNSGVLSISYHKMNNYKQYIIGEYSNITLLNSKIYNLYLENRYDELNSIVKTNECSIMEACYYQSIIYGYKNCLSKYETIEFSSLSLENKVAYLHNVASLKALNSFSFDSSKTRHFIENISLNKDKEFYSSYLDIYDGNKKKMLDMKSALEKLKRAVNERTTVYLGGTSIFELYKIKNLAIEHYFFYFVNHIFFKGYKDAKEFFNPYIEGILCANSEQAKETSSFWGQNFSNEKYFVEIIDFDIITKFISTKDLFQLVVKYNIKFLRTSEENILFLANAFKNLINSIITAQTFGFYNSSFSTLSNIALMLNLVELNQDNKKIVGHSLQHLFSDANFINLFFSTRYPDFKQSIKVFSSLFNKVYLAPNFEIIENIINSPNFFEFAANVEFYSLRNILITFTDKDDYESEQYKIKNLIDNQKEFCEKSMLLKLFRKCITDKKIKSDYVYELSSNFHELDTSSICEFIFNGWLEISQDNINALFDEIHKIKSNQQEGVITIPDPLETKLECIYILYIQGFISDISPLKDLADGRIHLQFLLNPDDFNYEQVDFSNYMWVNFARHPKYMEKFILHKDTIIPIIKQKIETNEASETERKILYAFLLNKDEMYNDL